MEHAALLSVPTYFAILVAIWIGAKLVGELAERIGQPAVLGELVAGVLLGGSVLHVIPVNDPFLHIMAEIGVCILLFEVGLETSLSEMLAVGPRSFLVAVIGVAFPFLFGYLYTASLGPANIVFAGITPEMHSVTSIFVGATLTATSVGITARVLSDLKVLSTREAKIILGAAVIDDVIGIVILSVVSSLAGQVASGSGMGVSAMGILQTAVVAFGFLVVAFLVGDRLSKPLFRLVDKMRVRGILLLSALSFALLLAYLADLAGSAMIIGSFAAGMVLARTNHFETIGTRLKPVADVFTPIFFVTVGAAVDVTLFNPIPVQNRPVLIFSLVLILLAAGGKLLAGLGALGSRSDKTLIGIGMIPRGEVGLIFAQQGLAAGVLDSQLYSAVTIMVIVTTFMAPPLLKWRIARSQSIREQTPNAT